VDSAITVGGAMRPWQSLVGVGRSAMLASLYVRGTIGGVRTCMMRPVTSDRIVHHC